MIGVGTLIGRVVLPVVGLFVNLEKSKQTENLSRSANQIYNIEQVKIFISTEKRLKYRFDSYLDAWYRYGKDVADLYGNKTLDALPHSLYVRLKDDLV